VTLHLRMGRRKRALQHWLQHLMGRRQRQLYQRRQELLRPLGVHWASTGRPLGVHWASLGTPHAWTRRTCRRPLGVLGRPLPGLQFHLGCAISASSKRLPMTTNTTAVRNATMLHVPWDGVTAGHQMHLRAICLGRCQRRLQHLMHMLQLQHLMHMLQLQTPHTKQATPHGLRQQSRTSART
jgi:hypothetical protein